MWLITIYLLATVPKGSLSIHIFTYCRLYVGGWRDVVVLSYLHNLQDRLIRNLVKVCVSTQSLCTRDVW